MYHPLLLWCDIYLATRTAGRRGTISAFVHLSRVVRACVRVTTTCRVSVVNTSYQKLPFGSGDHPDKLLFHEALN